MSKRVSCESKKPILVQESDLTSILGNSSEGSLTTSSNVETLERGLRLTSALSRYEKDQSQQPQSQGQGQAVRTVLQRHILVLLSEAELIPSQELLVLLPDKFQEHQHPQIRLLSIPFLQEAAKVLAQKSLKLILALLCF